jgi:hypothetical protein
MNVELYTPPNKTQFHYLPMECCTIQAWQRSIKPLTTDQRARVNWFLKIIYLEILLVLGDEKNCCST